MNDHRPTRRVASGVEPALAHAEWSPRQVTTPLSADTRLAIEIRDLVAHGSLVEARDRFGELVAAHQRRALRIALQYLRDASEADEAVQDAFVKVFGHLGSYCEAWPFEVWFTRILINACLDRRRSRARRNRLSGPSLDDTTLDAQHALGAVAGGDNPESLFLGRERRERLASAVGRLTGRQRLVFVLCHFGDRTPREVGAMTGLNESTVRVHLFRAAHKLRGLLGGKP